MKNIFLVKDDFVNSRIDRWFKKNICDVPQSLIEKNIRKGNIKINNKRKKSSYKLQKNDQIIIYNINFSVNKNKKKIEKYKASRKELSSTIFVEDNANFSVIDKPAGIAVQSGTYSRKNVLDILRDTKEFYNKTPFSVHRIDKETTGILLVAKNREYAKLFTSLFRLRKIHKTYLAIVIGEVQKNKGTFTDVLTYYEGKKIIKSKAITHFTVINSNINYSLLRLNPETGRKHQIRKQLLIHGHPVLGDNKYRLIDSRPNKKNLLMLHAYKIDFYISGTKYNFSADLPLTFKKLLKEKHL